MKNRLLFIGLAILLSFTGCGDDKASVQLIDRAELLLETNPDSAYLLLDSIPMPDEFSERLLARWCMLSGTAADKVFEDMPYVSQLKRAQTWFQKHGTPEEQARISLFLGRSYVEDREYDKAMNVYKSALDMAIKAKVYNQAGYICSYMADLYEFEDMPQLAAEKYKEAGSYFIKAGNERSYAVALRDVGRMYVYTDSCEVALIYLQKADTIATSLGDSSAMASICNGLGNIYSMLGKLDLAEEYLLKSIRLDRSDNAPSYLALAEVFTNSGGLEKARFYLQQATIPTDNKDTPTGVLYQSYLISKKENNVAEALHYMERYKEVLDSVTYLQNKVDIVRTEKSYDYLKVENENMKLKVNKQYHLIITVCLSFICLFLLLIYEIGMKRKNLEIYEQNEAIAQRDIRLLDISLTLQKKKEELSYQALVLAEHKELLHLHDSLEEQERIYQQKKEEIDRLHNELLRLRKEKLLSSAIVKKAINISNTVVAGAKKSSFSEKDWSALIKKIDEVYPSFANNLESKAKSLTLTYLHLSYISLLDLDTSQTATLLHVTTDTVITYRSKLRELLGIVGENRDLYEYLINI